MLFQLDLGLFQLLLNDAHGVDGGLLVLPDRTVGQCRVVAYIPPGYRRIVRGFEHLDRDDP